MTALLTHALAVVVGGFAAFAYFGVWTWAPAFDLWLPFERVVECATR